MPESTTNKILIGILVGITIWLVTNAVNYLLKRKRLGNALIADIKHRRKNHKKTKGYLETFFKGYIKEGSVLDYHAHFTKQGFPFYEDVRADLYLYFGTQNFITIMRCYEAFEEVEVLTEGIIKDFGEYANKKKALDADDLDFLNRKKDRIVAVIDILEQGELRKVSDIPRDYEGMMSAIDIIRK